MKRLLLILVCVLGSLVAVLVLRAYGARSVQVAPGTWEGIVVDAAGASSRLGRAVQFKTISHQIPWEWRGSAFTEFHAWLSEAFPRVHAALRREVVADYSLLYTWEGSDAAAQPIVLLAHMDVVPVDGASAQAWTHPPFEGVVADGYVWGRGTIDDKSSVMGILEAAEALLAAGFVPRRTIYFCFGHDEELGGPQGARNLAAALKARGVKAWFSLDEGSAVTEGIIPGVEGPVGLISVAEKGYVSVELLVRGKGGHSSNPPAETSLGILCAAVSRLEKHQMGGRLAGPMREMLTVLAPEMSLPFRLVMANLWLFEPLLRRQLLASPATAAALRTTTAPTILNAGTKENVLPIESRAVVNFRIIPGDTVETVLEHVRRVVNDDRVMIKAMAEHDAVAPSPVSDWRSESFSLLARCVRQSFAGAPVAPGLTLGGTDSKHFYEVAENCYRFQPILVTNDDLARIHGTDERIAVDNYLRAIRTYGLILRAAAG